MTEPTAARPGPANGELVNRVQQLRLNDQLGANKARGGGATWLPWALCGVMTLAWAGVGIRAYRAGALAPTPSGEATTTTTSSSPSAQAGAATIQVSVTGYLVAAQQLAVSPIDVGGRVVELRPGKNGQPFQEGTQYAKGDIIARLEDTSYKAQVAEAAAAVASAQRRLESAKMKLAVILPESVRPIEVAQAEGEMKEAEAQAARAKDQVERFERAGGGVSEQESRQARFDFLAADARAKRLAASLAILKEGPRQEQKAAFEAEVKGAEADVAAAEARRLQAQWRLDNCVIKAPIDGTVLTKKAELGNLVNPMAFSASSSGGGAVCDMANLADIEADLKIAEREIGLVKVGQKCRIRSKAYPDRTYDGRLDRIMPIANRADNTVNVRVKVFLPAGEVPGTYLKPDMGADVSFLAE